MATMHWAKDYYTKQSETFAGGTVTPSHRTIAARLHGWCGPPAPGRRLLELGAGAGGVAAALADLGHDVTAVEFNPSDAALARALAETPRTGALKMIEADFYDVDLEGCFDFVFYWDGFGIGTDADQRRLLHRIGREWLAPSGTAMIDVFSPWNWARRDGETSEYPARDGTPWRRTVMFDTVGSRIIDRWEPVDGSVEPRGQTIRCYTPPEFAMLVEGTGLAVRSLLGMDGREFDWTTFDPDTSRYMGETNGFYALLEPAE